MKIITEISNAMQEVLTTQADKLSKATGFVQRQSKMTGSLFSQILVFGWLSNPNSTLEELSQIAMTLGLKISSQGIDQRFSYNASNFLKEVLDIAATKLISSDKVAVNILNKFRSVYIMDSSIITLPSELKEIWQGNGGNGTESALKIEVRLDLVNGELHGPLLEKGRGSDKGTLIDKDIPEAGGLRIADLGYYSIKKLKEISDNGSYFLSRWHVQTNIYDTNGNKIDLVQLLNNKDILEMDVLLSAKKLPVRLIANKVPADEVNKRQEKAKRKSAKQGYDVGNLTGQLIEWNIFVTNVPEEILNFKECLVLLKARWQIELLFKLWKSYGRIENWRTKKPQRILCEVYSKLLAMLIQHWLFLITLWKKPNRSLVKASKTVRKFALNLAYGFSLSEQQLKKILKVISKNLQHGCSINKKKKKSATHQLLTKPEYLYC